MKQEEFSDKDIQNAKELIIASIKSMQDEQDSEISYCFGRELMREITKLTISILYLIFLLSVMCVQGRM